MSNGLNIGLMTAGKPFVLPLDAVTQTFALLAIRGAALMQCNPESSRHLFIEEAPEFVPQRTKVSLTAQCKEAVERIIRLGRNRGYGCTLISQRPATVDKDVLSQAGQAGCRRLLETLLERPELTKPQLGTLAGVSYKSSTFRNYMSWLKRHGLIETEGETVRLRQV